MNSNSLSSPNTPDDMDYELYAYDANGNIVNKTACKGGDTIRAATTDERF